jgi:hypothetical protein
MASEIDDKIPLSSGLGSVEFVFDDGDVVSLLRTAIEHEVLSDEQFFRRTTPKLVPRCDEPAAGVLFCAPSGSRHTLS